MGYLDLANQVLDQVVPIFNASGGTMLALLGFMFAVKLGKLAVAHLGGLASDNLWSRYQSGEISKARYNAARRQFGLRRARGDVMTAGQLRRHVRRLDRQMTR